MAEIDIDLTNYKDKFGQRVDPGVYTVVIEDAQPDESRAGNPMVNIWYRVLGGQHDGATVVDRLVNTEASLFRWVGFLSAIGMPTPRKRLKVNTQSLIGKRLRIEVADGEEFKGRVKSEVRDYLKVEGGAQAEPTDLEDLEADAETPEAQTVTVPAAEPEQVDLDSLEDL